MSYDLSSCLNELASDLDKRYKLLLSESFSLIKCEYFSKLYRINEWHNFKDKNGIFSGRLSTVTDSGRLKIERKDGKISEYSFKEVDFI
jgi:BirA family biotin operon repressor/biotin-[acetyl-CoA-carboxylase] ligase